MVEVSIFYKSEKTSGQTVTPIKIENSSASLSYLGHLCGLVCFGRIQSKNKFGRIPSKNKVAPLEVSIFQKSAKTEVKMFGRSR